MDDLEDDGSRFGALYRVEGGGGGSGDNNTTAEEYRPVRYAFLRVAPLPSPWSSR